MAPRRNPAFPRLTADWVVALGGKHGARERAAELSARTTGERAAAAAAQALERWTDIVAAMTRMIGTYNVAFEREVLGIADDRSEAGRPAVSIEADAGADTCPSLRASLDGTFICVCSRDADGVATDTEYPLRPDRDNDQTAAYILQGWMQRL